MTAHSVFSPSSAYRVVQCPASLAHNRDGIRLSNWYACKGTILHFIHAAVLAGGDPADSYLGNAPAAFMLPEDMHAADWAVVPQGYTITEEDVELVEASVAYCRSLASDRCDEYIETRVSIDRYTPESAGPQSGTCDYALVHNGGVLDIVDLKTGSGQKIYAKDNHQLALYALGFLDKMQWLYAFQTVRIHISQPTLGHFDVWETSVRELEAFGKAMRERFELALRADAPYAPEEKACKYCAFKPECKALRDYTAEAAFNMFDEVYDPGRMTPADTAWVLARRGLIRDFLSAVEDHAAGLLMHGTEVPGYKLVEGRSARTVKDPDGFALTLEMHGVNAYQEPKLITLSDAEKALGKRKSELAPFLVKPPGKPTLAEDSDPRPAWIEPDCGFEDVTEAAPPEDKL